MSTASLTLTAEQSGTNYTTALNNALAAINTMHSGTTAPSANLSEGKLWLDTSGANPVMKIYRNSTFLSLFTLNATTIDTSLNTITAVNVNTTSDERLKYEVATIKNALSLVESMRGVSYILKDSGKASVGVIAQEIEGVLPEVVSTDAAGYKSVAYGNLVGVLIEAIKEQSVRIAVLETKLGEKS